MRDPVKYVQELIDNGSLAAYRASIIEECALLAEAGRVKGQCGEHNETCMYIAGIIRALKDKP